MKKVININFQGRVVMIEEGAYENLQSYIDSLRKHFADEEGHDEIINDIESRISELFEEVIKKGNPCVSESDLDAIIASIGRPEDFEETESEQANSSNSAASSKQSQNTDANNLGTKQLFRDENNKKIGGVCSGIANYFNIDPTIVRLITLVLFLCYGIGLIPYIILWIAVPSSAAQVIGSSQKKLFRDISNKTIGGVCSGLANYFNIPIWVPKVIFILGAFCTLPLRIIFSHMFYGGFFFPGINSVFVALYIVLWAVLPPAVTASEKLSMKGESVDLNNIKSAVQEDLNDGKKRTFTAPTPSITTTAVPTTNRRSSLGDFLILIVKIFAYFILGVFLISIVGGLFAAGIGLISVSPLKDYILSGFWENLFAYSAFILLIWLPIIAIIIWIIRKLTKSTKSSKALRIGFASLWILGLICGGCLLYNLYNDFHAPNDPVDHAISIQQPKNGMMVVNLQRREYANRYRRPWFFHDAVSFFYDDSIFVNNSSFHIIRSNTDSFSLTVTKFSNGANLAIANELAEKINFNDVSQIDSVLNIPRFISINKKDKFRNQYVDITLAVPLGKKVMVLTNNRYPSKFFISIGWDNNDFDQDMDGDLNWDYDTKYLMTKDGLQPIEPDILRSKEKIQSAQQEIEKQKQHIQQEQDRIQQELEKQKQKMDDQIEQQKKLLEEQKSSMHVDVNTSGNFQMINPLMMISKALLRLS